MGILFTVFVSLSIGVMAIAQFFFYWRKRDVVALSIHLQSLFFAVFWLLMGVVWVLAGISDFLIWLDFLMESYYAALAMQVAVGVALVFILLFFAIRFPTQRLPAQFSIYRLIWLFFAPLFAVTAGFIWSVIAYGLDEKPLTFFSHSYVLKESSQIAFALVFIPITIFAIMYLIQGLLGWRIAAIERRFILFASISLILLSIGGALEQFGIAVDVLVPASRILILVAAMAAYIATTSIVEVKTRRKELVI